MMKSNNYSDIHSQTHIKPKREEQKAPGNQTSCFYLGGELALSPRNAEIYTKS